MEVEVARTERKEGRSYLLHAKIGMCDVEREKGKQGPRKVAISSDEVIVLIYLMAGTAGDREEMRFRRNTETKK